MEKFKWSKKINFGWLGYSVCSAVGKKVGKRDKVHQLKKEFEKKKYGGKRGKITGKNRISKKKRVISRCVREGREKKRRCTGRSVSFVRRAKGD